MEHHKVLELKEAKSRTRFWPKGQVVCWCCRYEPTPHKGSLRPSPTNPQPRNKFRSFSSCCFWNFKPSHSSKKTIENFCMKHDEAKSNVWKSKHVCHVVGLSLGIWPTPFYDKSAGWAEARDRLRPRTPCCATYRLGGWYSLFGASTYLFNFLGVGRTSVGRIDSKFFFISLCCQNPLQMRFYFFKMTEILDRNSRHETDDLPVLMQRAGRNNRNLFLSCHVLA